MSGNYNDIIRQHRAHLFGDAKDSAEADSTLCPFFTINQNSDEDVLSWLHSILDVLQEEQKPRAFDQLCNMRFYNGIQSLSSVAERRSSNRNVKVRRNAKITLNEMRDITIQSVARATRFPPQIDTRPWTNDYSAKIGAKFSKRVVDNLWYLNDFHEILKDIVLQTKICGEAYLFIGWDPYKGDLDKEVAKLAEDERYKKETFTTEDGERISLDMIRRVGDVNYSLATLPWFVFHEPRTRWKDVNYLFRASLKHIDEVRFENKGVDFDKRTPVTLYGESEGESLGPGFKYGEWVLQYEFWHKRHRFLDKGKYIKFVNDVILVNDDLPFTHGELPLARLTDIDDPTQAHGVSFYNDLRLPQVMYNNVMSLIYRNIAIAGHPKLFVPSGSANMYSMANGPFVVEYDGPIKPEIASFNTVGAEVFNYAGNIMNKLGQYGGVHNISRGDHIPNARAQSMLAFYEEQEEQRDGIFTDKVRAFIKKAAKLSLGVAGDFYEPDDGRVLRILGKNNQSKLRKLEDITLIREVPDVQVERTTALSESKQGRIDQIATLSSMPLNGDTDIGKPGLFTREQILALIDMADTETFYSMVTAAVDKARSENEDIFENIPVEEPQPWEMLLVHWNEHFQFLQSPEFTDTERVPKAVREKMLEHLETTEMYMYEAARKNATFAKMLLENSYYPAVFDIGEQPTVLQLVMAHETPPPTPQEQAEMALAEQGQAPQEAPPAEGPSEQSREDETLESDDEIVEDELDLAEIEEVSAEVAADVAAETALEVTENLKNRKFRIEKSYDELGNTIGRIIYEDGEEKLVNISGGDSSLSIDVGVVQ